MMNTTARIATVCQNGQFHRAPEKNREVVLGLLRQALSVAPDLVILPETFPTVNVDTPIEDQAEPVPGPTTDACAALAREHHSYVVCPIRTARDGATWNSAVILDRNGEITGIYDKIHPVTSAEDYTEMEHGVRPGHLPPPTFDLDFGRIGVQICFDAGFAESWQELAHAGARLVLWPSAYNGGFPLRAYAYLHHYYVVSSVRTDGARIIDPLGEVRRKTDQRLMMVYDDINLDFAVCHWDFNYTVPDSIVETYADRVDIRSDRDSAHFLVMPRDRSITIEDLKSEFGFETTAEYHERHRVAYRDLREGNPAPPQHPAHENRSQYSR